MTLFSACISPLRPWSPNQNLVEHESSWLPLNIASNCNPWALIKKKNQMLHGQSSNFWFNHYKVQIRRLPKPVIAMVYSASFHFASSPSVVNLMDSWCNWAVYFMIYTYIHIYIYIYIYILVHFSFTYYEVNSSLPSDLLPINYFVHSSHLS